MSSGIDIKFVQETFERLTDQELLWRATREAEGLTPEAEQILKAELAKRGLNANIEKSIEAQKKTYTLAELDTYCNIISSVHCPTCDSAAQPLNATITGEVISFVIMSTYNKRIVVGCPDCLDKANNNALAKSLALGWWGIPWGIVYTVQSIILNTQSKRKHRTQNPNEHLRAIALHHIGELEAYKGNKEKLQQILIRHNKS